MSWFWAVLSAVPDEGFSASRVRASLGYSPSARASFTVSDAAICSGLTGLSSSARFLVWLESWGGWSNYSAGFKPY